MTATNTGATTESGERVLRPPSRIAPKTVWFRYHPTLPGTAVFSSSGFDTVLTVYRGDAAVPIGCDGRRRRQGVRSLAPSDEPAGGATD